MLDIGWFSSGRDRAAIDLLKVVSDAIKNGSIQGKISFVFVTREKGEKPESDKFIDYSEKLGLEVMALSHRNFEPQLRKAGLEESIRLGSDSPILENWRKQYDDVVMAKLSYYKPDMIVLAGYMLIVSAEMCRKYKMINLHPALPGGPKGTWQEVIWQLMEQKAKKTGVMMHLITPELDAGPAITYCEYDIYDDHIKPLWEQWEIKRKNRSLQEIQKNDGENESLFCEIRRLGLKREFPLIVATLKYASLGEFSILNGDVLSDGQKLTHGFNLTNEVERSISSI
jgi:phosphoribosylglycinamide formyltransferase-1